MVVLDDVLGEEEPPDKAVEDLVRLAHPLAHEAVDEAGADLGRAVDPGGHGTGGRGLPAVHLYQDVGTAGGVRPVGGEGFIHVGQSVQGEPVVGVGKEYIFSLGMH